MKSLFFRILAVLLVSFVAVMLAAFLLFRWNFHHHDGNFKHLERMASVAAERLVDSHVNGDGHQFRRKLKRRYDARSWILDQENKSLTSPPVPPFIASQLTGYPLFITPGEDNPESPFIFATEITKDNQVYRVILESPSGASPRGTFWIPPGVRIALFLGGLLLASALLGHWMLRPLRSFQSTTRRISGDKLDARIPESITKRSDAFGELGREFNQMTNRVSVALDSQRQLLRDVSHELRSPLARIQVASSLLNQKVGQRDELDRIETEVERLDDLIERLLTLSRLQNEGNMEYERVHLFSLLELLIDDANFEFESQNKLANLDCAEDIIVTGDQNLLSIAFENILRNAMRFSKEGVSVEILVRQEKTSSGSSVRLVFNDSGPGVSEDQIAHLFEPFYKVDNARQLGNGHHGIGLALSNTIIKMHQGTISAKNRDIGGLSVELVIPAEIEPNN